MLARVVRRGGARAAPALVRRFSSAAASPAADKDKDKLIIFGRPRMRACVAWAVRGVHTHAHTAHSCCARRHDAARRRAVARRDADWQREAAHRKNALVCARAAALRAATCGRVLDRPLALPRLSPTEAEVLPQLR